MTIKRWSIFIQNKLKVLAACVSGNICSENLIVGSVGCICKCKVPEKYFDLFTLERENLTVKITRPAEKNMYEDAVTSATIENIAPYVSPESKNFIVVCRLDEPGTRFRPGMFVKVQVAYKTYENVPLISLKARKMDGSFYIYNETDSTVKFVEGNDFPVDGTNFIVPEEYRNSYIVMDGQNFVFDGQKVRVFEAALKEAKNNTTGAGE